MNWDNSSPCSAPCTLRGKGFAGRIKWRIYEQKTRTLSCQLKKPCWFLIILFSKGGEPVKSVGSCKSSFWMKINGTERHFYVSWAGPYVKKKSGVLLFLDLVICDPISWCICRKTVDNWKIKLVCCSVLICAFSPPSSNLGMVLWGFKCVTSLEAVLLSVNRFINCSISGQMS